MNKYGFFIVSEKLDSLSGERMRVYRHYSGFSLTWIPRRGYHTKTLAIGVIGGASALKFEDVKTGEKVNLPFGTPHALKHMIYFNHCDSSLEAEMAKLGASIHAWTGYDVTTYYLESGGDLIEPGRILLNSLLSPLDTEALFAKEKDVLLAERRLYYDQIEARSHSALRRILYPNHAFSEDYVGTVGSIDQMTYQDLKMCQDNFYVPGNLRMVAIGDYSEDALLEMVASLIEPHLERPHATAEAQQPIDLPTYQVACETFPTHEACFFIGIRDQRRNGEQHLHGTEYFLSEWAGQIGLDLLFGEGSDLNEQLRQEGLIDDRFTQAYWNETDLAMIFLGGYHSNPEEAAEKVSLALRQQAQLPMDPEDFVRKKNALIGTLLGELDRLKTMTLLELRCSILGFDLYDYPQIIQRLNIDQVDRAIDFLRDPALSPQASVYFYPPRM